MSADNKFLSWEEAVDWLLHQPEQAQLVIDCYYDNPLIGAAKRYWHSDEWLAVRERLTGRHGKALDVGAGRGIASYALAKEGFTVTALEPDSSTLVGAGAIRGLAEESGIPIQVVEDFSERLPFSDAEFEVVFARAVLHHTSDLGLACREYFRVLKPGGIFLALREHVISRESDLPRFFDIHPLQKIYGGENAYMLDRYIDAIKRSGFKQVDVLSPWHSPMNFSPYSLQSLKVELAKRASLGITFLYHIVKFMLGLPGVWGIARYLLRKLDNRPGRLYSFIAEKI